MEDKFDSFYKDLQTLFGSRLLSQNEIREYMQFVESSSMEKNAFIAIVQYCIGIKGSDISSAYILKVAKYFAQDDILTVEQVEKNCLRNLTGSAVRRKKRLRKKSI